MFVLDQRQKIGTKRHMQISGMDRKATTKIAKTLEKEFCLMHKNPLWRLIRIVILTLIPPLFSDNSTKSNDSSISDEPYLPLNVLLSGVLS